MGRKRPRGTERAAPAPSRLLHPPATSPLYFRYVSAPEDERRRDDAEGDDNDNGNKFRRRTPLARGQHQRDVDRVDIPAPTEWLAHDAAASAKLRAQAQTDLQVLVPRRPSRLPHSERHYHPVRQRDPGLVAAVKSTVGNRPDKVHPREMRPGRVLCGGEVLPWGTWPARLRHHEGQCFYDHDNGGDDAGWATSSSSSGGAGTGVASYFWVGGGSVGRSGGGGGVGTVSEGSIHDDLLRQQFPPSFSASFLSRPASAYQHQQEEMTVTRLKPDSRGRWAAVKARRTPPAVAAVAAASPAGIPDSSKTTHGRPPSPYFAMPTAASKRPSAGPGDVVTCLIPGRYGGWVEFEESLNVRSRSAARQQQKRRVAVAMAARFGPDGGEDFSGGSGDGSKTAIPDSTPPLPNLVEETQARQTAVEAMAAEAGAAAAAAGMVAASGAKLAQEEGPARSHPRPSRAVTTTEGHNDHGGGGGERSGDRGRSSQDAPATIGPENVVRGRDFVDAGVGGFRDGSTDNGETEEDCCRRKGWTVSEPAKETVRRVWNRARRRARDSSEPRHRTAREGGDRNLEKGGDAAGLGEIRDTLDPGLLSCLGRECEGIIDAALHVVLDDRLRLLRRSSPLAAFQAQTGERDSKPPPSPPPPPPPLATADWQDVLRAMKHCSDAARGITPAAVVNAAAHTGDDGRQSSSLELVAGGGAEARGSHEGGAGPTRMRGGGGGEGPPGLGEMTRRVWGAGGPSDGSVVVVNEHLPGLPLNDAVLTRAYNRLLLYLHEKQAWKA